MTSPGTRGCTKPRVVVGGWLYSRRLHPIAEIRRCSSCNAAPGYLHHYGCAVEACPACGGQLAVCACEKAGTRID